MTVVSLEPIDAFQSPGEFERFERWIDERLDAGELERVPLRAAYAGLHTARERWYRDPDGVTWRLVDPDPPFRGVFESVEETWG